MYDMSNTRRHTVLLVGSDMVVEETALNRIKSTKPRKKSKELGFGNQAYSRTTRLIHKGGTFNVKKDGQSFWESLDTYHELISMSWWKFFGIITALFFLINLFFAIFYFMAGPDTIGGSRATDELGRFIESFYFSTQTITTVGFGKLNPQTNYVSLLAAFESFLGLLGFALATGLMFARFSRPNEQMVYSENAIVAPYRKINGLMFRFAHAGKNQLSEAEVQMVASRWLTDQNRRTFEPLKLERKSINFFTTSWTVVHPINEESPLYGMTAQDCAQQQLEIIVMFKAYDDTYARNVYDRTSYVHNELLWGKKFAGIYDHKDDETIHIAMDRIGKVEDASLN